MKLFLHHYSYQKSFFTQSSLIIEMPDKSACGVLYCFTTLKNIQPRLDNEKYIQKELLEVEDSGNMR
jgi:hypothetical protein